MAWRGAIGTFMALSQWPNSYMVPEWCLIVQSGVSVLYLVFARFMVYERMKATYHVHTFYQCRNYSTHAWDVYTHDRPDVLNQHYNTEWSGALTHLRCATLRCDWLSLSIVCISNCSNTLLMNQSGAKTVKIVDDDNSIEAGFQCFTSPTFWEERVLYKNRRNNLD